MGDEARDQDDVGASGTGDLVGDVQAVAGRVTDRCLDEVAVDRRGGRIGGVVGDLADEALPAAVDGADQPL
jgi:hypothetical protein